jgi:hypothetical protein
MSSNLVFISLIKFLTSGLSTNLSLFTLNFESSLIQSLTHFLATLIVNQAQAVSKAKTTSALTFHFS